MLVQIKIKITNAYIALEVFLSMFESGLSKLGGKLGRRVVQKVAILSEDVSVGRALLLCLVWIAIVLRLWLRLRGRRR